MWEEIRYPAPDRGGDIIDLVDDLFDNRVQGFGGMRDGKQVEVIGINPLDLGSIGFLVDPLGDLPVPFPEGESEEGEVRVLLCHDRVDMEVIDEGRAAVIGTP